MQAFLSYNKTLQEYHHFSAAPVEQETRYNWREGIELLEHAQLQLAHVRADPALMPPLHFQMDHALAIFAPLLFPLLLPMAVGLRREYKRYKTGSFV